MITEVWCPKPLSNLVLILYYYASIFYLGSYKFLIIDGQQSIGKMEVGVGRQHGQRLVPLLWRYRSVPKCVSFCTCIPAVYLYTISNCTQPNTVPANPFSFHHSTHVHKTFYRKRVSKSTYVLFPPHQNTLPPYSPQSPQSPQASPLSPHSPLLITLPPHQNDTPTNFEIGRAGNTFPSLFARIQFDKCHWGVRTKNVD